MNKDEIKNTLPWMDQIFKDAIDRKADAEKKYNKTKVFVSMAMSGRTDKAVHESYLKMLKEFSKIAYLYGLTVNDFEFLWTYEDPEQDKYRNQYNRAKRKNVWCLGHALQILQKCDFVLMNEIDFNVHTAKGVQIEHEVCKLYGIPVMYI